MCDDYDDDDDGTNIRMNDNADDDGCDGRKGINDIHTGAIHVGNGSGTHIFS